MVGHLGPQLKTQPLAGGWDLDTGEQLKRHNYGKNAGRLDDSGAEHQASGVNGLGVERYRTGVEGVQQCRPVCRQADLLGLFVVGVWSGL